MLAMTGPALADPVDESARIEWDRVGPVAWSIADGEYAASGLTPEPGYLVSRDTYGDFSLRLELWVEAGTNSGVFVRCQSARDISPSSCYEANIWDDHPDQRARTGSLVTVTPPLAQVETVGRWSTMEIEARGEHLTVRVNGQTTARIRGDRPREGHIALQYGGTGAAHFRAIQLIAVGREAPRAPPDEAGSPGEP